MESHFIQRVITTTIIYFDAEIVPNLASEKWASVSYGHAPIILWACPDFQDNNISWAYLVQFS